MKIIIILLTLICLNVKAETYYLDERPIEDLNLRIEEKTKYKWYKEKRIEAYFLEDTALEPFILKENQSYYTAYSEWSSNMPRKASYREIKERDVYVYKELKKIRYLHLEIESEDYELIEFSIYVGEHKPDRRAFCNGCSSNYLMYINDNNPETIAKVPDLFIELNDYYHPDDLKIKALFKNKDIKYKISFYEKNTIISDLYYENTFFSSNELEEITIKDLNSTAYAYGDSIIKYEPDDSLYLDNQYKEYSYRDKYVLYYGFIKDYYPTYEEYVEDYQKDEKDFIVEKTYFYKEPIFIKDHIVIKTSDYDLNDYIVTNLKYEIASNIDISKNGKYLIKYIFANKTIEKEVEVKTNNEYIKDLELKIENKNQEILDVITLKNEIIERLENNLKTKDEIISKKEIKTIVKKSNIIPIVLITIGIMLLIFCILKNIKKMSK